MVVMQPITVIVPNFLKINHIFDQEKECNRYDMQLFTNYYSMSSILIQSLSVQFSNGANRESSAPLIVLRNFEVYKEIFISAIVCLVNGNNNCVRLKLYDVINQFQKNYSELLYYLYSL